MIRLATIDDLQQLLEIAIGFRDFLGKKTPTENDFSESIKKLMNGGDAEFAIAFDKDGAPAGYVLLRYRYNMWVSGLEARVEDLYVDSTKRQGGIGKKLIEYAISHAAQKNCVTMCLDTNENNAASNKIYKKLGFQTESESWNNGKQIFYRRGI